MAIPRRTLRNLQDIRTHSRASVEVFEPHKAFMRLTCLEMEKARREMERESALERVRNIETRFREIEAEKTEIMRTLMENNSIQLLPGPSANCGTNRILQPSGNGFKFKY
jgi:hypothetical protein